VRLLSQTGLCHFQILTAGPPVCHMEQGTLVRAFCSPVRFDAGVRRRPEGPAMTSSLSSAYKGGSGWKYPPPPFHSFFLPTEVSTTTARRQLVTALPGHSMIPLVKLLLTPTCFFCPRFHNHRARASASTVHPAGDLQRCW
jgi:hypothetical protein